MTYSKPKDEVWIPNPFSYTKLHEAGYAVGGYQDDDGKQRYILYQVESRQDFRKIHDFETLQELLLMAKLLIEGGM
jgi:hypothetical protein